MLSPKLNESENFSGTLFNIIRLYVFTNFIGDVPKAAEHWRNDRFFGSQFLNGCNPESIKRCTKLPANFLVTQELVGNLLDTGDTLKKALKVTFPIVFTYCS